MDSKIRISYSSITDFNNCSRLYYFRSIYRNPETGNRIQLVNPYLSLGSAVHDTIDEIVNLSPSQRLKSPLIKKYEKTWEKYSGKRGGFTDKQQEKEFKKRGVKMIKKVEKSMFLKKKTLRKNNELLEMDITKEIKLVGSFDWIEVLKNGNLHIIDFKTGRSQEKKNSWQLPIYQILAQKYYSKKVEKLSYWYLEKDEELISKQSINSGIYIKKIKEKSKNIKKTIENNDFSCSSFYNKCFWCRNYEYIISGKAEHVGFDEEMKKDLFFLKGNENVLKKIQESNFLDEKEKKILKMRLGGKSTEETREKLKLSKLKIKKLISEMKNKIKGNLTRKELLMFINELDNNGKKFNM